MVFQLDTTKETIKGFGECRIQRFQVGKVWKDICIHFFFGYSKPVVNVRNISQSRFGTFYAYTIIKLYYVLQGSFFSFQTPMGDLG